MGSWFVSRTFASAVQSSAGHGWPKDAARELPDLPLEDLLQLVHLYAERGSPKYERAALRLTEGSPRLQHFAEITAALAKREAGDD